MLMSIYNQFDFSLSETLRLDGNARTRGDDQKPTPSWIPAPRDAG